MSGSVSVNCVVLSIQLLVDGIRELSEAMQVEDVRQKTGAEAQVENCHGQKVKVDYVIRNKAGDRIGVRENKETKQVEFIAKDENKASVKETVNQATQAYARLKILNEVKARGYGKVKEEKLPNGAIRLVVERWR